MPRWLFTLIHRFTGYVAITVTFKDGADPESFWAQDVYTEDGALVIDTDDGQVLHWSLAEVDFLVTG